MQNNRKHKKEIKLRKRKELHKLMVKEAKLVYELTDGRNNYIFGRRKYFI